MIPVPSRCGKYYVSLIPLKKKEVEAGALVYYNKLERAVIIFDHDKDGDYYIFDPTDPDKEPELIYASSLRKILSEVDSLESYYDKKKQENEK